MKIYHKDCGEISVELKRGNYKLFGMVGENIDSLYCVNTKDYLGIPGDVGIKKKDFDKKTREFLINTNGVDVVIITPN